MSRTSVTQLMPTLSIKDDATRAVIDSLIQVVEERSGFTNKDNPDRFVTAREFDRMAGSALAVALADSVFGDSSAAGTNPTTQKINTTSSCEAELVGLAKGLQQTLWARTFLIGQGFATPPITIYQDNQSTIKLVERGRPAAEQSRHINIGYFWIHDLIKRGVVTVKFCPTLSMIADYFTKPLQGSLFTDLRNQVLGVKTIELL